MHMDEQGVEYMQFAFRWMNCLLMREISVKCTIRMWDTYLVSPSSAIDHAAIRLTRSYLHGRPREPTLSRSSIFTSARHSWSSGARNYKRWISRSVQPSLGLRKRSSVLICRFGRPQEIIMFLQRLPTDTWKDHDVELLLSEAFVLKSVWQGAENHFNGGTEGPLGGGMGGR
jgi:hypothetical protein